MMTDEQAAKAFDLPRKLVRLLRVLPNYDPFALAQPGDYFDLSKAEEVIDLFLEHVKHPEGPLVGEPVELAPWQESTMLNFYGWRRADGRRRFRECLIYVPKKNGKTTWATGWMAIELAYLAAPGSQFYSAASNREQAALAFQCFCKMRRFDEDMKSRTTVYGENAPASPKAIMRPEMAISYKPLSKDADSGDGVSPDFLLIDELHRHASPELAEVLIKSTAAKPDAVIIKTTTADYDRPSLCNREVAYARQVCANQGDPNQPGYDPAYLPVVYEITPKEYKEDQECWRKPEYWRKANPNIDISVKEEFYAREAQKCGDDLTQLNNFLRLHLNIITDQSEAWIDMMKYDACQAGRSDEELIDCEGYGGFDLSCVNDLTSFSICWAHPDGGYDQRWWYWIPDHKIVEKEKKDNVPYRHWQSQGFIELIPGEVIDIAYVNDQIYKLCERYNVKRVGADPWNNAASMQYLINRGIEVERFAQGPQSITEPGKEMERRIIEGTFRHNGHPIARWNFANAMIKHAPNESFSLDKKAAEKRIDGVAAAIMAVGMCMRYAEESRSAYEEYEVLSGGY
jgi:phage terminase large subunit-like protein